MSQFAALDAQKWFGLPAQQTVVVHNGLPDRGHQNYAKPDPNHELVFFAASRLDVGKNLPAMLQGFVDFARQYSTPARLVLAGSGPMLALIQQLATANPEYLHFVGSLPYTQVDGYIRQSHAVVVSTRAEAFGMTVIEAMMHSTPVLANATGGIMELMAPEVHGLLVQGFDAKCWKEAFGQMAKAITNPVKYQQWRLNCRIRYEQAFTQQRQLNSLLELIRGTNQQ